MRQYLVTTFVLIALVLLILFAFTGSISAQEPITPTFVSTEGLNDGIGLLEAVVIAVASGIGTLGAVAAFFNRIIGSVYFIGWFEAMYAKSTAPQKAAIRAIVKFVDEITDDIPYESKAPGFNRPQDRP
jgi:hypothetical protein